MYRGFNLLLNNDVGFLGSFLDLEGVALPFLSMQRRQIERTLNSFLCPDGSLNGSKMKANWFPQINADIFISHSHEDEQLAIALAGWLHEKFGLVSFIDSCIWGYANDLLQMIDNSYCYNELTGGYDYSKRNYSTSHVHMMLSVALTQMIDKTECLFFLNTPNSISSNPDANQTGSPWIYSEISTSQLIRKRPLEDYRKRPLNESLMFSSGGQLIRYDLSIDHLVEINELILTKWRKSWRHFNMFKYVYPEYSKCLKMCPLDKLYKCVEYEYGQK